MLFMGVYYCPAFIYYSEHISQSQGLMVWIYNFEIKFQLMVQTKDTRVEVARLQKIIQDHLGLSSDNVIFEYSQTDRGVKLDLVTVNPRHNQSFLFKTTYGIDKQDALHRMVDYVKA